MFSISASKPAEIRVLKEEGKQKMGPGKETVDYTLGSKTAKNYLNYSFLIKAWEALKDNRFSLNRIKKIPERYDLS